MKCCFCGYEMGGMGNNPAPVNEKPGARCCDECNNAYVIPARFLEYLTRREEKRNQGKV